MQEHLPGAVVFGVDIFDEGCLQGLDEGPAQGDNGDCGQGLHIAGNTGEEHQTPGDNPDAPAQGTDLAHGGGDGNGPEEYAELNEGADEAQGAGLGEAESQFRGNRQKTHRQNHRCVGVEKEARTGGGVDPPSNRRCQRISWR